MRAEVLNSKLSWILVALGLFTSSCGPIQGQDHDMVPAGTLPGISDQVSQTLFGKYVGDLYEPTIEYGSLLQDYTAQFTSKQKNGTIVPYLAFQSNGSVLGDLSFETEMETIFQDYMSAYYAFLSPPLNLEKLSSSPVRVSLLLTVYQGKFYPTQSEIRFLDCGLNPDYCSNPLFEGTVEKR